MIKQMVSKVRLGLTLVVLAGLMPMALPAAGEDAQWLPRATIYPSIVTLEPGEEKWFKVVRGSKRHLPTEWVQDVEWSVNNIPGGNETLGTISKDGTYTAPAKVPVPREINICAKVSGVVNPLLWATVLFDAPGEPYELVTSWGETTETSKLFLDPHCIALDKEGNILVADSNAAKITRFTPDGEFIGTLGDGMGEKPGQFLYPRVVAAGPDGNIYVGDVKSEQPRIQVFSHEGEFLRAFAPKGDGEGEILRIHGLAFDSNQNLFVADVETMRVTSFNHKGEFLNTWGNDGRHVDGFNVPHGLVVDPNGEVFVSDYYGSCRKFTNDGLFLNAFAHPAPPEGAVYIHSSGGDQWGNVYLVVRGSRDTITAKEKRLTTLPSIMKYNNNGDHVSNITLDVSGHSENWVTVDKEGRVYAVYVSKNKFGIQIYEPR